MEEKITAQDTELSSQKEKRLQKILGVFLGIFMCFAVLVSAFEAVLFSPSFFLKQNKEYNVVDEMGLYNVDNYIRFYTVTMDYLKNKDDTDYTLYVNGEHLPMFTQPELARLEQLKGWLTLASILRWACIVLSVGILVYVLATAQREGLRRVGFSSLLTVLGCAAAVLLAVVWIAPSLPSVLAGFERFFFGGSAPFTPDMILYHAMGTRYAADLASAWVKMSGIFTLAPFFISFGLARLSISKLKHDDFGDDYLYQ